MRAIDASSQKISDIIGTIDSIAFQTNILALNAAVEAARAGDQGRGFAVVATEVRNLAQRSAVAAKEIKNLISKSAETVGAGTVLVNQAGETMEQIVESVKKVAGIISEISEGAVDQTQGIEQINTAVSQLDRMTQANSAVVEESAAAAASLKEQAYQLSVLVDHFQLTDTVRTSRPAQPSMVHAALLA
jgi:methyl-accepting chemotaxis protein